MKKILFSILALVAIATTAGAQTKFGLEVGGVQVTSANFSNITGGDIKSGTVKYNPTNRKLTLTNVKIERSGSGRRGIYNEKIGDLTIVFEGTNTITTDVSCALRCEAPTTLVLSANSTTTFTATKEVEAIYVTKGIELEIQGSDTGTGSLTVKANKEYAIEGDGKETIRFTKAPIVTLNGVQGNLVNLRNVIFNASSTAKTQVTLKAVGSAYSQVQNVTVWTEQGYSHIETPAGAKFDSTAKTIMLNGKKVANQDVVINEDVIPLNSSTKIPDANFRAYLKEKIAGGRNYLTYAEAQQVTAIDVNHKKIANLKGIEFFTALERLLCYNNQLTSLDVSKNTALKTLYCYNNQLTSLDLSKNTALTRLECSNNQLTLLDVSKNTKLSELYCYRNQIKGGNMLALVNSLPKVTSGKFYVINTNDSNEGNVITKPQVAIAKGKGWKVADVYNHNEYEGSDPIPYKLELTQGTNIVTSLSDYAVIRLAVEKTDVFTVEEGELSIVLKSKKTGKALMVVSEGGIINVPDDVTSADNIEFDITAADHAQLKSWFTEDPLEGYDKVTLSFVPSFIEKKDLIISFPKKVNTIKELNIGEGTIEAAALYALVFWEKLQSFEDDETGDLVFATMSGKDLFQIGDGVVTVFDDVTSADNIVYTITDKNRVDFITLMELPLDPFANYKTIQIKFEFGTTGIGAPLNDNGQMTNDSWYTIDGKKLNGEPTKKGVYIIKGKKVKK